MESNYSDTDSTARRSAVPSPKGAGLLMVHHRTDRCRSRLGMDISKDSGVRAYTLGRQREKDPMRIVGNL